MSRAYREAKGDIVWIIDCNVWVDTSVAGRLVDLLCGFEPNRRGCKYKFVHQLPLGVDLSKPSNDESEYLVNRGLAGQLRDEQSPSTNTFLGGRLDEMFLSTSHAKFYTAISTVAVAPCIVGKSNMFRRSHLNAVTASNSYRDPGIDYFSENICEDHLIGDLLWKRPVPESVRVQAEQEGRLSSLSSRHYVPMSKWGNHGLLSHSYAIQPMHSFSLKSYLARRTRWLRVRKFTVLLATLVEPGTESFLCSAHGAFGLTTLPWCNETLGIPRTWSAFCLLWLLSVCGWCLVDSKVWSMLQESGTISPTEEVPGWIKRRQRRGWREWIFAWVCRETFALPIWLWAVLGGLTVSWRGRRFWVGMDLKVHEIDVKGTESREDMGLSSSRERDSSKGRTD